MKFLKKKYIFFSLLGLSLLLFFAIPPKRERLWPKNFCSFQVLDRNGKLLREVLSKDYKTSIWVPVDEISKWMVEATVLREDKRFRQHPGVDPLALVRALFENIKKRKIVAGGSTITMQGAKMALGFKNRNLFSKCIEILYALKIELHISKKEILEIYLNRAPYGFQNFGVEAASQFYFHKPAGQLSLGEASLLAVIPKSPSRLNPYIHPQRVLRERERLLKSLLSENVVDSLGFSLALQEHIPFVPGELNFKAPHFVDYVLMEIERSGIENPRKIVTTLDLELQENLEKLLFTTLESLKRHHVKQGAILVMNAQTGEILSMVGSKDYFDPEQGQVNGCLSLRQPGSAIKPFTYILALRDGLPASFILPDIPLEFGLSDGTLFAPRNYSWKYHGPVSLREALAASLNVPTVYLLDKIGVERLYNLLKELNFESLDKEPQFYGLSLALGAGEVKLLEMVRAYRTIARGGVLESERSILEMMDAYGKNLNWKTEEKKIFSKEVACIITDILSDNSSRIKSFGEDSPLDLPFPCAVKTGTSKDYRDNWCVGFTTKYVVGIWVGNFEGFPMKGISGISGAAPLFRDIMIELHRKEYPPSFEESPFLVRLKVCIRSGKLPKDICPNVVEEVFIPGTEPDETCDVHYKYAGRVAEIYPPIYDKWLEENNLPVLRREGFASREDKRIRIVTPSNGDIFKIDPQVSLSSQGIVFRAEVDENIGAVLFKLDGEILCKSRYPFKYIWKPEAGEHKLEVIPDSKESCKVDRVVFRVF